MNHLIIGLVLLGIGGFLVVIGLPNKAGEHPRFLQFDAAVVLYTPLVLAFIVLGAAEVLTTLLGIQR